MAAVEDDLHSVLMMVSEFLESILNAIERFVMSRQDEGVIGDPVGKFFVRRQPVRQRIGQGFGRMNRYVGGDHR